MKSSLAVFSVCLAIACSSPAPTNKGILDCLTNPCLNVPGVGKLKGTKKVYVKNKKGMVLIESQKCFFN